MRNRYRIVKDHYAGFEAQVRYWWFPFCWFQLDGRGNGIGTNTRSTVEGAREVIRLHLSGGTPPPPVVEVVEHLDGDGNPVPSNESSR